MASFYLSDSIKLSKNYKCAKSLEVREHWRQSKLLLVLLISFPPTGPPNIWSMSNTLSILPPLQGSGNSGAFLNPEWLLEPYSHMNVIVSG